MRLFALIAMKITALKLQARNPNRVNVFVDGAFAFGLVKSEAVRLRVGQELTESEVARLQARDSEEMAYLRILKFLAVRPRSEAEVRQRLRRQGVDEALQAVLLERLRQANLLNDAEFAQQWVENRAAFRPRSKRALQAELRHKGVSASVQAAVLPTVDEASAALNAARKRAARWAGLTWAEFRHKMGGFLARRGFDYDTISATTAEVWGELTGKRPNSDSDPA